MNSAKPGAFTIESMLPTTIRFRLRSSSDETLVFMARMARQVPSPDGIDGRISCDFAYAREAAWSIRSPYGNPRLESSPHRQRRGRLRTPEYLPTPVLVGNTDTDSLATAPPRMTNI
jgi:hypothetical protein